MTCFRKNRIIDSRYMEEMEGVVRIFFRKKGTKVVLPSGKIAYAIESEVVVAWDASPYYDSGYHGESFPATMKGLKMARWHFEHRFQ